MDINGRSSPTPEVLDPTTAYRAQFICKMGVIGGAILYLVSGPESVTASALAFGLLGSGLACHVFIDLYQSQPQLAAEDVLPYAVGMGTIVLMVTVGLAYELIDSRVGIPFFAIFAGSVMLFARKFTYAPDES